MESPSSAKEFLDELASRSKDQEELKRSIDTKAMTKMTITATATSLLTGFAAGSIFDKKVVTETGELLGLLSGILLLAGLILGIVSILIFLYSSNPKHYYTTISLQRFFTNNNEIDRDLVRKYTSLHPEDFSEEMALSYLTTMKKNSESNKARMRTIFIGQLFFGGDVCAILVAIMMAFFIV